MPDPSTPATATDTLGPRPWAPDVELLFSRLAGPSSLPFTRVDVEAPASAGSEDGLERDEHATLSWLCRRPPGPSSVRPRIWLARKEGRTVGRQAGIPVTLRVGGRAVDAYWAVGLLVHPAWRLKGVGPLLMRRLAAERPVTLAMGISDAAYRLYRRAGWLDLGRVPRLVRPLRPARMVAERHRRQVPCVLSAADGCVEVADRAVGALQRLRGYELEARPRFGPEIEAVLHRAEADDRVRCVRSPSFLRWRFDESPDSERYGRYLLRRGGRRVGYGVVSRVPGPHGPILEIVDLLADGRETLPLLHLLLRVEEARGALAVHCSILDRRARRAFRLAGFLSREPDLRLMAHLRSDARHLEPVLLDPHRWRLTMADGDCRLGQSGE